MYKSIVFLVQTSRIPPFNPCGSTCVGILPTESHHSIEGTCSSRKLVSFLVFINLVGTKVERLSAMRARILLDLFTQGIDTSSAVFIIFGIDKKVFVNSSRYFGCSDESVCFHECTTSVVPCTGKQSYGSGLAMPTIPRHRSNSRIEPCKFCDRLCCERSKQTVPVQNPLRT